MAEKSQSLEVISNSPIKKTVYQEKRRRPRIGLTTEQFRLAANGKLFSVIDLSMDGMAFRVIDRNDLAILPIQTRIEGILNLKGNKYFVQGRVKHLAAQAVGCSFEELSAETRDALSSFLDPEVLGKELRPIPSSSGLGTLWYHGPSGTDLILSRGIDGQCRRFTLYLLGTFIQWDEQEGLTTGGARSSENRSDFRSEEWGIVQFETMIMTPDEVADPQKMGIAKALVLSSNLSEDLKKWCARQLSSH